MNATDLPWLQGTLGHIAQLFDANRVPHGLIVHGPKGVGKQQIVDALIARWLELPLDGPLPAHADLIKIAPEDGKKQISVDAVRGLIKRMVLTSSKGRQVAVITPAEAMNRNAANSLLKTLEEPTEGTLLILVTDSVSRLLPTIISRCQRIQIRPPAKGDAQNWLSEQGIHAESLLDLTGNAPLEAKRLADAGLAEQLTVFESQLQELSQQQVDVPTVASSWLEHDAILVLDWLYYFTANKIRLSQPSESTVMHHYLTGIASARVLASTALNTQLLFESLLTPWYDQFGASMAYLPTLQR